MRRFHVKKNDEVVILAGADKRKRGRIIAVLAQEAARHCRRRCA